MDQLVELATRSSPSTAIDIGCGPGAFSVGLASRTPVSVLAIDLNPEFLERARSTAKCARLLGNVAFLERSLKDDEEARFDVVVCIGSSGAVGTPREALNRCKELMAPQGLLVFADLVWNSQPSYAFLEFLEIDSAYYWLASEGKSVFSQCGLFIEHELEASRSSWENYERAVFDGRLRLAASLSPAQGEPIRIRATAWYANFEKHGRQHLGFNAYVARNAEA